jgi:hypothetical protein
MPVRPAFPCFLFLRAIPVKPDSGVAVFFMKRACPYPLEKSTQACHGLEN